MLHFTVESALYKDDYATHTYDNGKGKPYSTTPHPTANIFRDIHELAKGKSLNCHLWSCFGGAAAKDVEALGEGSILAAHSSDNNASTAAAGYHSISRIIEERIQKAQLYKDNPSKAMLDCFTNQLINYPETATFAAALKKGTVSYTSRNSKEPLINDLERYLREKVLQEFCYFREDFLRTWQFFQTSHSKEPHPEVNTILPLLTKENSPQEHKAREKLLQDYQRHDFLIATFSNNTKKVKAYIKAINDGKLPGLSLNSADDISGHSPFLVAASTKFLKLFLGCKNIDIHQVTTEGETALHFASPTNIKHLVKAGLDVNQATKSGETPLNFFLKHTERAPLEHIKALLAIKGIDVNKADINGSTPLHYGCANKYRNKEIITLLVRAKDIDTNKPDKDGITPPISTILNHRYITSAPDIVKLLINNGAVLPDKIAGVPLKTWAEEKLQSTIGSSNRLDYNYLLHYIEKGPLKSNAIITMPPNKWNPLLRNITGEVGIKKIIDSIVKKRTPKPKGEWVKKVEDSMKINEKIKW